MDIILFSPPRYRNGFHFKFNNALLWLGSYLYQRDIQILIVPLTDDTFESIVRDVVAEHKPKFVAVSCKWWDTLYSASYIATLVKQSDPDIVTIAGGQTASFFAQSMVEKTDFDVVIRGDGEEPLYRLITGQKPFHNCVFEGDELLIPVRKQYVQTSQHLDDIFLVENPEEILTDTSVLNSYIWTGKGCAETCSYCSANALNNVQLFGRAKHIYRPKELIIREIDILSRFPGSSRVTFDFDPVRGKVEEDYYLNLFSAIERKKFNMYFFSWSLPTKQTIDALAETFNFVELSIDVQTCSDRLRKYLGDHRYLKPYYSDEALDETLAYIDERYENFAIDLSTLMGLPFEQNSDIEAIKHFSDYFYDKFKDVRYPYVSPMNVEPGAMVHRDPDRYDMVLFRSSFDDFYQYTQRSFENNINCYQPKIYEDGVFHPLGVCSKEDYKNGDIFRVYETWKGVQENVDNRSQEKMMYRTRKYKKFDLLQAGILGGIDREGLAKAKLE